MDIDGRFDHTHESFPEYWQHVMDAHGDIYVKILNDCREKLSTCSTKSNKVNKILPHPSFIG